VTDDAFALLTDEELDPHVRALLHGPPRSRPIAVTSASCSLAAAAQWFGSGSRRRRTGFVDLLISGF
jgi:hypothetical protein